MSTVELGQEQMRELMWTGETTAHLSESGETVVISAGSTSAEALGMIRLARELVAETTGAHFADSAAHD